MILWIVLIYCAYEVDDVRIEYQWYELERRQNGRCEIKHFRFAEASFNILPLYFDIMKDQIHKIIEDIRIHFEIVRFYKYGYLRDWWGFYLYFWSNLIVIVVNIFCITYLNGAWLLQISKSHIRVLLKLDRSI